ncbi:MAG TPA: CBS domain-containing protein [Terriglobia bacterium]|nr:CBS domain-containing protein [Terriglobia bacterium]
MRSLDPFLVEENATIKEAILQIEQNNCRCVVVVGRGKKRTVTGVFSQGDVLRAILDGVDVHTPLNRVVSPTFKYLKSRDLAKAADYIRRGLTLVPVLDNSYVLKDVITFFDVMDSYGPTKPQSS